MTKTEFLLTISLQYQPDMWCWCCSMFWFHYEYETHCSPLIWEWQIKKTFQTNWVLNFQEFQAILGSSKRLLQDVNLKRRTVETSWWQFHQIILSAYNYCTWFFTQFHVTVLCLKVSQWSTDHTFKNTFSCGEINECLISCWYYCQHDIQLNIHSVDMF